MTKQGIVSEFEKTFSNVGWIPENKERIIDFWLSQLKAILEEIIPEEKEVTRGLQEWDDGFAVGYNICRQDISSTITKLGLCD